MSIKSVFVRVFLVFEDCISSLFDRLEVLRCYFDGEISLNYFVGDILGSFIPTTKHEKPFFSTESEILTGRLTV